MKDHEIRESINELRDIAIKYRDAECLREAIAPIVHSIVQKSKPNMKKVKDLKVGDRINLISSSFFNDSFFGKMCLTGNAKIVNIYEDEDKDIFHELHFEGTPKNGTYGLILSHYQTEFEVI
jgi:hypothetical protein